jgi:hypothetical protein
MNDIMQYRKWCNNKKKSNNTNLQTLINKKGMNRKKSHKGNKRINKASNNLKARKKMMKNLINNKSKKKNSLKSKLQKSQRLNLKLAVLINSLTFAQEIIIDKYLYA